MCLFIYIMNQTSKNNLCHKCSDELNSLLEHKRKLLQEQADLKKELSNIIHKKYSGLKLLIQHTKDRLKDIYNDLRITDDEIKEYELCSVIVQQL